MLSGAIKASEREGVFRTNQREISPALPLSTSAFSTCLLHSELGADSAVNDTLMAAVCARSELETITQVCKLARAVPRAVDLSGAATLRALVRCAPDSTDVATIIDIGATKTSIATRQGRYLRSLRVVGVGGADFTRAIVSATKDDPEAAEQRKHSMRVDSIRSVQTLPQTSYMDEHTVIASDSVSQTDFEEAAERVCVALLEQIQDAVDQDASTYDSYPQGIILTGGGALLGGLKERISQRLGVQTRIGRPWGRIERNRKTETYFTGGTEDVEVLQTLSTAIGLGLWTESK
jgi:cell division ATPase FtsA